MKRYSKPVTLIGVGCLLLGMTAAHATGSHGADHMGTDHDSMMKQHMSDGTAERHGHGSPGKQGHSGGGHRHNSWVDVPEPYAGKQYDHWGDADSVARGEKIFEAQCQVCHGAKGVGNGPAAEALSHQPADFTNHFHMAPGKGDAYLYWRVSEGGLVEPFRSADSAMPAFKDVLDRQERWDVLNYIHTQFHKEFKSMSSAGQADKDSHGHDDRHGG